MDQHRALRPDIAAFLGSASRVSEVLNGKKGLSLAMVQRLRGRFRACPPTCCCRRRRVRPRRSAA